MKKMIFAAACVALVSGCSDLPQKDSAVHEETYVMTGSHIARKAGTPAYGDAKVVSKEELERQVQNQSANLGSGPNR
ncbi:hypothetical protein GM658_13275 [Pseudoduganella eburnea]|uniref:Lipoprotein n=1 Tax=Massilia eburnea TaxID=1776165 RepID=A0A6L6QHH5_9BURK|nr:membrane lipoprotein lipid attachment site-containing protein [Massilia eburnea]MTW11570.1 hypothetical protein [Massilia eburnea]